MNELTPRLYETADYLARESSPPVELYKLCNRFGIRIVRRLSKPLGKKRALLLQNGDSFEILLPESDSNEFTAWERFLIAHELGHFFLSDMRVPKPLGEREYWLTESICDQFARRLLLPSREVSSVISISGNSASDLLGATLLLNRKWAVPWMAAAFEVTSHVKAVHFLNVTTDGGHFRVAASTFPNKRGLHSPIARHSVFGEYLRSLPKAKSSGGFTALPIAKLHDFEPLSGVSEGALYSLRPNDYQIALLSSPTV
jgi:hypothetical protein